MSPKHSWETCVLIRKLENILVTRARRMLMSRAGVTCRDSARNLKVARRCGIEEMGAMLRARRLR